jgi:chromosomal replication initiation ATPase DnaA
LARAWLSDASLDVTEDAVSLVVGSRFKADYIRQNFGPQLDRAARECGLQRAPAITTRGRAAR